MTSAQEPGWFAVVPPVNLGWGMSQRGGTRCNEAYVLTESQPSVVKEVV